MLELEKLLTENFGNICSLSELSDAKIGKIHIEALNYDIVHRSMLPYELNGPVI